MLKRAEVDSSSGFKNKRLSNTSNTNSENSSDTTKEITASPSTLLLSATCASQTNNPYKSLTTISKTPTLQSPPGSPSNP